MIILNDFYQYSSERYLQEKAEKKEIRFIGTVMGLGIIGYVILQTLFGDLFLSGFLGRLATIDPAFNCVATIFLSLIGLLIPFGICGVAVGRRTGKRIWNFEKPVSIPLMLAAVPFGFFVCLAGNYVTSWFVNFMDGAGVELTAPEFAVPDDFAGRILYIVTIAVVPALVEEFAIRGAVMQPLRRYGDKFAIVASALFFGILHGNLIQAPFAVIAGIAIGYAVCITNSLWTGILIHFANNLYSVFTEFMIQDISDLEVLDAVYTISSVTLTVISVLGSVVFILLKSNRKLMPSFTVASEKTKMLAFILNIPMIIAIIIMLVITSWFVSTGG